MPSLAATWFYSTDSGAQKQPVMSCEQNHLEVERKTQKREREGGGEKEEVIEEKLEKEQDKEEDEKEKKNKNQYQKKKFVSRPLMDTLWAMFKFKKKPPHFWIFHHLHLNLAWQRLRYDHIFVYWPSPWCTTLTHINHYPYFWMNHLPTIFFFLQINRWFCKKRKIYQK